MNRRGFLKLLGLAAATAAVDPEQLLWTPGEKTHFLPPDKGWSTVSYGVGSLAPGDVVSINGVKGQFVVADDVSSGLSIRLIRQYDIRTDKSVQRMDVLYGYSKVRPDLACRVEAIDEGVAACAKALADKVDRDIMERVYGLAAARNPPPLTITSAEVKRMWEDIVAREYRPRYGCRVVSG